jgi:hypothetical protein
MIKCQCGHCLHILKAPANAAGRKVLCPLCGDPFRIPDFGEKVDFRQFVFAEAIEKFQLNAWDKAFARELRKAKKITDDNLYKGICGYVKARRKKADLNLAAQLVAMGALGVTESDAIRELIRGTVKAETVKFVDCPNCFAKVDSSQRSCKFCGQRLTDPAYATCPACKHEQKKGPKLCVDCGADMVTGLKAKVQRCPACNAMVFGEQKNCPSCRVVLQTSRQKHMDVKAQLARQKKMMMLIGAGAVAAIILIALLWGPVGTAMRASRVGYARATLEETLDDFRAALKDRDVAGLRTALKGGAQGVDDAVILRFLCTGSKEGKKVAGLRSVTTDEIKMSDDEKSAVITVVVRARMAQKLSDEGGFSLTQLETYTVSWKWVLENDAWTCVIP